MYRHDRRTLRAVLDGLDEIPKSLRGQVIQGLNYAFDNGDPVVLTCRTDHYRNTVADADAFTAAAVIELQPASLDDLADYLLQTATPHHRAEWERVLGYLRENPNQPVARTVGEVLPNPLMTALARTIYEDRDANPTDLLDDRSVALLRTPWARAGGTR